SPPYGLSLQGGDPRLMSFDVVAAPVAAPAAPPTAAPTNTPMGPPMRPIVAPVAAHVAALPCARSGSLEPHATSRVRPVKAAMHGRIRKSALLMLARGPERGAAI